MPSKSAVVFVNASGQIAILNCCCLEVWFVIVRVDPKTREDEKLPKEIKGVSIVTKLLMS